VAQVLRGLRAHPHAGALVPHRGTGGLRATGQVLAQPVELRDVLPTFLDAAGAWERGHPARIGAAKTAALPEGRSLLSLVRGETANWHKYIDLDHNICYNPENNWNALTDGRFKYSFYARDGEEQLFNLEQDPHELNDCAGRSRPTPHAVADCRRPKSHP